MNLQEVRLWFVQESGRYDLVVSPSAVTDNGADKYVNAGQRMLDRMMEFPKDEGEFSFTIATSAISTSISNVMSVRAVSVFDTSDKTIRYLERRSMREMRELYGGEVGALDNVTPGEPRTWSLGWLRTNLASNSSAIVGATKKLVTMPPADRSYTIKVAGLFNTAVLSTNTSVSFWSDQHPDVLVLAALYRLEVGYRNFEGSRALLDNIIKEIELIDSETVEQSIVEKDQLKDSHRFIKDPLRSYDRHIG
ncbi:MAG: hypothetical protein FVQ79_00340 [Planctomycetes bacterium]|nr:hypothetical protein [Planctomycetota bacterium]